MGPKIELVGIKGEFEIKLYGPDGILKAYRKECNLVVTTGFDEVCDCMGDYAVRPTPFRYCGVGSGTESPAAGDTILGSEISRVAGVYVHSAGSSSWYNDATFLAGIGTGEIHEAGIFNNGTVDRGTMLSRQTFAVINKESNDVLTVRWTYSLT